VYGLPAVLNLVQAHHSLLLLLCQVPKAHISALLLMLSVVVVTAVTASLELTCGTVEVSDRQTQPWTHCDHLSSFLCLAGHDQI
jgi:hypothetical protein